MGPKNRVSDIRTRAAMVMRSFAPAVSLLSLALPVGCGGGSTSAVNNNGNGGGPVPTSISGTIAVGTAPRAIAVDTTDNKVYVANFGIATSGRWPLCQPTGTSVTVIDGATQSTSAAAISVGGQQLSADANVLAVVVNSASQTAYVVFQLPGPSLNNDCFNTEHFLTTINGGQPNAAFCGICQFGGMAVNPGTNTIYLGNWYKYLLGQFLKAYISVFSPGSTFTNFVEVPLTSAPIALAVNPATNKVYVALAAEIDVIDGVTNSLTKVANTGATSPNSVAANPATNTIYVVNSQSNNLTVIDGATDSVTATIPVGTAPSGVDLDSQTNFIYVANAGNSQAGDPGNVSVINGATNATTTLSDPNAKNPVAIAVNPLTNKIYVANSGSNNVTVIDGAHD